MPAGDHFPEIKKISQISLILRKTSEMQKVHCGTLQKVLNKLTIIKDAAPAAGRARGGSFPENQENLMNFKKS